MTGPAEAIRTCLAKSFQFKGRATRSEFWWFAPVGIACIALCCVLLRPIMIADPTGIGFIVLLAFSFLPLTSAGARRLSDTGARPLGIMLPCGVAFAVIMLFVGGAETASTMMPGLSLLPVFLLLLALITLYAIGSFGALGNLFAKIGETIGQLLLPTQLDMPLTGPSEVQNDRPVAQ